VELGYKPSLRFVPKGLNFKAWHMTTKSGPNGHALWTAMVDYVNLPESLKNSLLFIGGPLLAEKFSVLDRALNYLPSKILFGLTEKVRKLPLIRKLTYFPDKEAKVRVVAIGDYFSQSVLRPLHSYLFKVLKKIPQDKTFFQGGFRDRLTFDGRIHHSIDLTSATDRVPIKLISSVLKGLLPHNYVDH